MEVSSDMEFWKGILGRTYFQIRILGLTQPNLRKHEKYEKNSKMLQIDFLWSRMSFYDFRPKKIHPFCWNAMILIVFFLPGLKIQFSVLKSCITESRPKTRWCFWVYDHVLEAQMVSRVVKKCCKVKIKSRYEKDDRVNP